MNISISSAHSGGKLRQPARVVQQPFRSTSKLILPGPTRPVLTKSHPCPDPEEEKLSAHDAFMQAVDQSKCQARIEGLQEFAAAIWERKRRIPSTVYNNPLQHLFDEYDLDGDGRLTAAEVTAALQCRGVKINEATTQRYINDVDTNHNGTVERDEWERLIFHMASVDLQAPPAREAPPSE